MKKLVFLLVAVTVTAISARTFAQGTGTAPSIGSVHQYWVNGTYASATSGTTSTYTWWISTDPTDLLARTTLTADFTVTGGTGYDTPVLGSANGNGIEIKWNPTASTSNHYYLVVQEDGADPLCTNIKAVGILPTNNFKLLFEAIAADGSTLTDDPTRCPAPVTLTASGAQITYNYGSDNFMFKLTASDLYSDWSFVGTFVEDLVSPTVTIDYKIGESGTFANWAANPNLTVDANTNGTEVVYFRVNVDNGDTSGSFEENLAERTITLTLTNVKDEGDNPVTIITNNNGDDITSAASQVQTIQARPSTSGISSN